MRFLKKIIPVFVCSLVLTAIEFMALMTVGLGMISAVGNNIVFMVFVAPIQLPYRYSMSLHSGGEGIIDLLVMLFSSIVINGTVIFVFAFMYKSVVDRKKSSP